MNFGHDIVRECYHCQGHFREMTLLSGNTFRAVYFTDGKREAPMLPTVPWLVACPHCNGFVWRDRAEEVGHASRYVNPDQSPERLYRIGMTTEIIADMRQRPEYRVLTADEWLGALESAPLDRERELYVRRSAWWATNDPVRRSDNLEASVRYRSNAHEGNMWALIDLLKGNTPDQRLMVAELYRELGDFDDAAATLFNDRFPEEYADAVQTIHELIEKRIVTVARLSE